MQHNKKNCPALIGMYYFVDGVTSSKKIAETLGIPTTTAWQVLNRKYNVTEKKEKATTALIDAIEREYLAGASTYELGDKYGVYHGTIGKWMKKRGHVRGKGNYPNRQRDTEAKRNDGRKMFEEHLVVEYGGTFTCIDYTNKRTPCIVRCNVCGLEFTRCPDKRYRITCPSCRKSDLEKRKEEKRNKAYIALLEREAEREAEYSKEKHCVSCGAVFHSECETKIYCSDTCSRREKRHRNVAAGKTKLKSYSNHRKRARLHGVEYEPGITLKKLIERDGNICQICGEPCDENDLSWGYSGPLYPSIDHIVAIANGGSHTWDNVQLAHVICNSRKRDLDMEEVIAHAEEQGITHKCA